MADENARRDENQVPVALAVTDDVASETRMLRVDPTTKRLKVSAVISGLTVDKTITPPATTGAQTINKAAGSVNFAGSASSLVVTNSLVTATSLVLATIGTNDASMTSVQAVITAPGSFTLYPDTPPTGETRVNFLVIT